MSRCTFGILLIYQLINYRGSAAVMLDSKQYLLRVIWSYNIAYFVTSFIMQHCYGIYLAFLKIFIRLYSAGLPGYSSRLSNFEICSLRIYVCVCVYVILYLVSRCCTLESSTRTSTIDKDMYVGVYMRKVVICRHNSLVGLIFPRLGG